MPNKNQGREARRIKTDARGGDGLSDGVLNSHGRY
jgi:hypothetical protein